MKRHNIDIARTLRRSSTDAERKLWSLLRARQLNGHKFRRQFPIGPYIADFVCAESRLVIELDGGGHAEESTVVEDGLRTAFLEAAGYRVLRFWNDDVLTRAESVLEVILRALPAAPHPGTGFWSDSMSLQNPVPPLPGGERE